MAANEFVTTAFVKDGKLSVRNRAAFDEFVACQKDGEFVVSIERQRATRSLQANAYYHGVVVRAFHEHTGYTPLEAHELLKALHLPRDLAAAGKNGVLQGEHVIGGSTTKLDKQRFYEYVEDCRNWLAQKFDIQTPDPDPGYMGASKAA